MIKSPLQYFILTITIIALFSSCRSIRQANYIERKFFLAKAYDSILPNNKAPFSVTFTRYTITRMNAGGGTRTSNGNSIDVSVYDSVRNHSFLIDDRKSVFAFLENEPSAQPFIKEFKRRKKAQRIHRYSSLATMAAGILMMGTWGGGKSGTPTEQQRILGNTGACMFLGGFINWIGGGFGRAVIRRKVPMKAMYVYYFGELPHKYYRIKKEERRAIFRALKK